MKNTNITKTLLTIMVMSVLVIGLVGAQETTVEDASSRNISEEKIGELKGNAGVTPGNALYGLERAWESVSLAFTFNKQKKAEKRMGYANERLLEAKEMAENNNTKGFKKALQAHDRLLARVNNFADDSDEIKNSEDFNKSLEKVVGLQKAIEVHNYKIEVLEERLLENISEEDREAIQKAINNTRKSAEVLEGNLERKEQRTATRFRAVSETGQEEIEKAIRQLEKKQGLRNAKESIANDRTQRVEKNIARIQKKIQERKNNGMNVSEADKKLQEVKERLQKERQNFSIEDYEASYKEIEKSVKGIQKASNRLRFALENSPSNASQGIQTALRNVENASEGLEKSRDRVRERENISSIPKNQESNSPEDTTQNNKPNNTQQ